MNFFDKLKRDLVNSTNELAKDVSNHQSNDGLNNASCVPIIIENIPSSIQEFKYMAGEEFDDPNKIVAFTVAALCIYPVNKDLCVEMLNFLKGPKPLSNYEIQFLRDRLRDKEYVPVSYLEGAVPENNYEPKQPFTIKVYKTNHSEDLMGEGYLQLFLKSGGADTARGVRLRKKESTGQWFLWEYFLLPDIRKPKREDPWS